MDEALLAQARDPTTPPARLHELLLMDDPHLTDAVLRHPNIHKEDLLHFADWAPQAFLANPRLHQLAQNPAWQVSAVAMRQRKAPTFTPDQLQGNPPLDREQQRFRVLAILQERIAIGPIALCFVRYNFSWR